MINELTYKPENFVQDIVFCINLMLIFLHDPDCQPNSQPNVNIPKERSPNIKRCKMAVLSIQKSANIGQGLGQRRL